MYRLIHREFRETDHRVEIVWVASVGEGWGKSYG